MTPWNLARWLQAVKRGQKARPGWFASHGDDMLGVGATPGVEPEREVTVIHDDDSDDGGGGVEKGGRGAAGGEALADLEEELSATSTTCRVYPKSGRSLQIPARRAARRSLARPSHSHTPSRRLTKRRL